VEKNAQERDVKNVTLKKEHPYLNLGIGRKMENSLKKETMFWLGAMVWFLVTWVLLSWFSMFNIFFVLLLIMLIDLTLNYINNMGGKK